MKKRLLFPVVCVLMLFFSPVKPADAGTNISVSCDLTTCTTTPSSIPLFNEPNVYPGYSVTQTITATNITNENGALGLDTKPFYQEENQESAFLPTSIFVEIHRGAIDGPIVYGGGTITLYDLFQAGQIDLGTLSPNQTQTYFFKATLSSNMDDSFQRTSIAFDLDLGFNFSPVPTVRGTSDTSGGGGGGGSTSTYSCGASAPSTAPNLFSATNSGAGQVTLNWTAVPGADHYAINFGIQPGVYLYGNSNVGNVTSYVVTGLSPGNKYYFQVIPINDCAPGPRSNELSNNGRVFGGNANVPAPSGFTKEQVLGETSEASQEAKKEDNGSVLGSKTGCSTWKPYLPFVFLLSQLIISVVIYLFMNNPENKLKQVMVIGIVILTTGAFYWLRNCNCAQQSLLALLCTWYFVVAICLALVTQFLNYALIEREE